MMESTFFARIDELANRVGDGHLIGVVEVNQVYAHRQHEELLWEHPRGGKAKYLEDPMVGGSEAHARTLAKHLLDPEGPRLGMQEVVEDVARDVYDDAPREFGDLRNSAHPSVVSGGHVNHLDEGKVQVDGGEIVYDRPPLVPRLDETELREKNRLRDAGHRSYPLDHPQHIANRIMRAAG